MGIFGKPPETKPPDPAPRMPPQAPTAPAPAPGSRPASSQCLIGAKTVVKGEITGDEDVLVEGTVEGQIRIKRDLKVGATGVVRATVEAQSIAISGEVTGDCVAGQRVEVHSSGRLTGNIKAPRIVIVEGAVFKGNSDMSGRKDETKPKAAGA